MSLQKASNEDFEAVFGHAAPPGWSGLVERTEHMVLGVGGVYWLNGRWWVTFWRSPGVRMVKTAHRAARIVCESAIEAGLTIHAVEDHRLGGARLWLDRLGFRQTTEEIKGYRVWTLSP